MPWGVGEISTDVVASDSHGAHGLLHSNQRAGYKVGNTSSVDDVSPDYAPSEAFDHKVRRRTNHLSWQSLFALVAQVVGRAEIQRTPSTKKPTDKGCNRLRSKHVSDEDSSG